MGVDEVLLCFREGPNDNGIKRLTVACSWYFLVFPIVVITYNTVSESKSRKSRKKCKLKSRPRGCSF